MSARLWVPLVIVLWLVVSICLLLIALGPRAWRSIASISRPTPRSTA